MKDKLAIFDMDGTLFDTKMANYEAYKWAVQMAGEKCIVDYREFIKSCFGRNYTDFLTDVFLIKSSKMQEIHTLKTKNYKSFFIKYAKECEHTFNILRAISIDYHIALITTASKKNTYELLGYFHRTDEFDLILTAEDVKKLKPNPEGYEKAIRYFNVTPENTVVFDDSLECIYSALQIGIRPFQIFGQEEVV